MTGEANKRSSKASADDATRARDAQRVTMVAMATNLVLSVIQVVIGVFANAFSLVADAVHTFSDLLTDAMVFFAARKGADPADENHPYGHDRIETVVSMFLGLVLVGTQILGLVGAMVSIPLAGIIQVATQVWFRARHEERPAEGTAPPQDDEPDPGAPEPSAG